MDEELEISFSRGGEDEEQDHSPTEKLACYRCRQRKVKCDRGSPCSLCVRAGAQCSYAAGPKPRERRQRVTVSKTYDSKLDAISRKIDALGQRMSQLSHEPAKSGSSEPVELSEPINVAQGKRFSYPSSVPTPSSSSLGSTPNQGTPSYNPTSEGVGGTYRSSSKPEHEGESSLFAHAVFASRFLQNAINSTTNAEVASEMEAVLDGLRALVHSGKQQSDTLDRLYPHAKALPPGSTTRSLPLPPVDRVFACMRMARECPQVATLWLGDYIKPAQFSDYFIKVASPGPAAEADLIVVHCGLYWLFCECSKAVADEDTKHEYDAQALVCRANLETVLANLRFHQQTNMDSLYAMGMAALYCLQKSRPSAAWSFISSASHMIQALGLHRNGPGTEGPEDKAQKASLFWTIYMTEKMLSLRLGRSSTFRDQDITLPRPGTERPRGTFLAEMAPGWVSIASIQGRVYDDVYSPGALIQPPHVRTSRARALAAELKTVMQHAEGIHDRYEARKGEELGLDFHEIARRSDRVIGLSMLTLIYRSIPPENPSTSAFCEECIDAAREALHEHDQCISAITRAQGKTVFLEAYINWTITQPPFTPFIILFCRVIETRGGADLERMGRLVATLESASAGAPHDTCERQRRLFGALCDVAAKYVEVGARADCGQGAVSWPVARQQYAAAFAGAGPVGFGPAGVEPGARGAVGAPGGMPSQGEADGDGLGLVDGLGGPAAFGDVDVGMDLSGAELWDWFDKNQSIMRMLEDT